MDTEINTRQIRSVLRAKADALAALIHPDFIYVNASGQAFDKDSYVDTYCASGQFIEGRCHSLCVFSAVAQEWQWAAGQTMAREAELGM